MINQITKLNAGEIISDVESSLAMLGEFYGLKFTLSKKKYSDVNISFSVEVVIENSPKVAKMMDDKLARLGLPSDTMNSVCSINSKRLTVVSIDVAKRSFPVIVKDDTGHTYKISVSQYLRNRI